MPDSHFRIAEAVPAEPADDIYQNHSADPGNWRFEIRDVGCAGADMHMRIYVHGAFNLNFSAPFLLQGRVD